MSKHLAPLALLCVCLFAGPATAADTRPRDSQYFETDYESAYDYADLAYALGFDVQIVYDLTDGGAMTVYVYTDGQNWWYPCVLFDWFDKRGRWYSEIYMYPDKPPIFP